MMACIKCSETYIILLFVIQLLEAKCIFLFYLIIIRIDIFWLHQQIFDKL